MCMEYARKYNICTYPFYEFGLQRDFEHIDHYVSIRRGVQNVYRFNAGVVSTL
jgi:hypothetical protein